MYCIYICMYIFGERNVKIKHIKHHIQDSVCLWERDTVSCKDIGNILLSNDGYMGIYFIRYP